MADVETVLFGKMKIPDTKDEILKELERCKARFLISPTRYLQTRINCLECALDEFRRLDDV